MSLAWMRAMTRRRHAQGFDFGMGTARPNNLKLVSTCRGAGLATVKKRSDGYLRSTDPLPFRTATFAARRGFCFLAAWVRCLSCTV